MADKSIGSGYDLIGTRSGQNGTQEYFNTQSGLGFSDPQQLANFVKTQYNPSANANNVFDILKAGNTPLDTAAPSPTQVLNNAQKGAFDAIKSSPVSDPNALRETTSQAIGDYVNTFQTQIQSIQKRQESLLGTLSGFFNQSDNEQKLTSKINNLDTSYEMGQNGIEDKAIPMQFITGQQASNERRYTQQRNTLVRQLTSETASRQQKLEAAKFLYDSTRNSLSDTIQLMQATAPDNIGSYTNKDTGDMFVVMKNPVTGKVYNQNVGNTGTSEQQQQAKEFALQYGIQKQFYQIGNTIYNTATGQGYPTWEAFLAAGGDPKLGNVDTDITQQPVKFETKEIAGQYVHIGYNAAGEVVHQEVLGDAGKPGNGKTSTSPNNTPSPSPAVAKNKFTSFPVTASANNIRNWLLANWHKKAGQPYYDVWGQAADIMRENGIDPSKFDDTFWAVFRPGETNPNQKKRSI